MDANLLQWPFVRVTYPGIDNPMFVDDIEAANQGILAAAAALCGLGPTDFAIISGLDYIPGVPNTYAPGVFYLNGTFYFLSAGFTEGLYLAPNVQPGLSEAFSDGNSRNIYNILFGMTSVVGGAGLSPQMIGNMNAYRMGAKYLSTSVTALLAIAATLGTAAFANIGSAAGTVAAGNDPRMPYTQAQLDAKYAQINNVIVKAAGTAYTPLAATDPANKGYVDNGSAKRLLNGTVHVGDVPGAGILKSVFFTTTLADANYIVLGQLVSNNATPGLDEILPPLVRNKTTNGFDVWFEETFANVQNLDWDWIIFEKIQ